MDSGAIATLARVVGDSGLVEREHSGVILLSGGSDSTGLAAGLAGHCDPARWVALHLDYGLRPESALDAEAAAETAKRLGLGFAVERPELGAGNLQDRARGARYEAAERLRVERGLDLIATGHTRTDVAETVIYRLIRSPGARSLLGLAARSGPVARPLLSLGRDELRKLVVATGLPFRDDATNAESRFARNRIRNEVMPLLEGLAPAPEATIAATRAELAEDSALLEDLAAAALADAGVDSGADPPAVPAAALAALDPALARRALRILAERAAGDQVALGSARAAEIARLAAGAGGTVELGGGVRAEVEQGRISFRQVVAPKQDQAEPAQLSVPGACEFGAWRIEAADCGPVSGEPGVVLDRDALGSTLTVRSRRPGDRLRPLGLDGAKSLQDLFTDRRVPRTERDSVPLVCAGERIAWVAGVEIGDEFKLTPASSRGVRLTARHRADPAAPAATLD